MKKSIFAKIALFLSSAGALLSTVVAFGAEPANDSAAPSVFEEMAIENGVMPTSIRQIIETITKNQGRPYFVNIESTEVMGRSLQAASSTYPFPRTVYLVSTKTPFATGGPAEFLFSFGYTPNDGKLEIISWNRHLQKVVFIEGTNLRPGQSLSLNKKVEAICASCHQAKAPILSRFPWQELDSNNAHLRVKIEASREKLTPEDLELLKYIQPETLVRTLPESPAGPATVVAGTRAVGQLSGFTLDPIVRRANRALQTANICKTICAPGDAGLMCRRHTFLISLFGKDMFFESNEKFLEWEKAYLEMVKPRWPKDDFAYASSVIPDRDPLSPLSKNGSVSVPVVRDAAGFAARRFANDCSGNRRDEIAKSFGMSPTDFSMSCGTPVNAESDVQFFGQKGQPSVTKKLKDSAIFQAMLKEPHVYSESNTTSSFQSNNFSSSNGTLSNFTDTLNLPYSSNLTVNGRNVANPGDPSVPRPKVSAVPLENLVPQLIEHGSFGCFGIGKQELTELFESQSERSRMSRELLKSKQLSQLLAKRWLPSREQTEKLFEVVRGRAADAVGQDSAAALLAAYPGLKLAPKTKADSKAISKLDLKKVVQQRCAGCHGDAHSPRPLPLGGEADAVTAALRNYKGSTGKSVVDYLNGNGVAQMPLGNATGLTPSERAFLVQTLSK